jgi:hypothetical protein
MDDLNQLIANELERISITCPINKSTQIVVAEEVCRAVVGFLDKVREGKSPLDTSAKEADYSGTDFPVISGMPWEVRDLARGLCYLVDRNGEPFAEFYKLNSFGEDVAGLKNAEFVCKCVEEFAGMVAEINQLREEVERLQEMYNTEHENYVDAMDRMDVV